MHVTTHEGMRSTLATALSKQAIPNPQVSHDADAVAPESWYRCGLGIGCRGVVQGLELRVQEPEPMMYAWVKTSPALSPRVRIDN